MEWVKMHTDMLGKAKVMRAARKGAMGLQLLPWLILFAKRAKDQGRLTVEGQPAEFEDFAAAIPNLDEAELEACLATLVELKTLALVGGAYVFISWERRQGYPSRPSQAPEQVAGRVAKSRAKKGGNRVTRKGANLVTHDITQNGVGSVTHSETQGDVEGEEEVEERSTKPLTGVSKGASGPVRIAELLPVAAPELSRTA